MPTSSMDPFLTELYIAVSAFLGGQHQNVAAVFTEMLAVMDAQLTLMGMDAKVETSTYNEALYALQTLSDNLPDALRLHSLIKSLRENRGPDHTEQRLKTLQELHKLVIDSRNKLESD